MFMKFLLKQLATSKTRISTDVSKNFSDISKRIFMKKMSEKPFDINISRVALPLLNKLNISLYFGFRTTEITITKEETKKT